MVYRVVKTNGKLAFDLKNWVWIHAKPDFFQRSPRTLEVIAGAAFESGLDGIAIPRCYDDRFEDIRDTALHLSGKYEAIGLGGSDKLGDRVYKVIRTSDRKVLYVMCAQMTPTKDQVNGKVVKAHPYAVGYKGRILNDQPLKSTLNDMQNNKGIITICSPFKESRPNIGTEQLPFESLQETLPYLDYMELPSEFLRKSENEKILEYAKLNGIPVVAVSSAHSISQFGISYIKFNKHSLDTTNEDGFFESLKATINARKFENHYGITPMSRLLLNGFMLYCHQKAGIARRDKSKR